MGYGDLQKIKVGKKSWVRTHQQGGNINAINITKKGGIKYTVGNTFINNAGVLRVKTQKFVGVNANPNKDAIGKLGKKLLKAAGTDKEGSIVGKNLNYENRKNLDDGTAGTKHPTIRNKGITVTRAGVKYGAATPEQIAAHNLQMLKEGKFGMMADLKGRVGKAGIEEMKTAMSMEAKEKKDQQTNEELAKRKSSTLKGISMVFGSFNEAFQRNSRG